MIGRLRPRAEVHAQHAGDAELHELRQQTARRARLTVRARRCSDCGGLQRGSHRLSVVGAILTATNDHTERTTVA